MSHGTRQTARHNRRTVFVAGRLRPQRQPKPCSHGHHAGPFLRGEVYDTQPWDVWHGFRDCASCGSTIFVGDARRSA